MAIICDRCGTKEAVKSQVASKGEAIAVPAFDLCHPCAIQVIHGYAASYGLNIVALNQPPDSRVLVGSPLPPITIDPAVARIQELRAEFGKTVMVVNPPFPVQKGQVFEWGKEEAKRIIEAIEESPAKEGLLVGWFVKLSEKDPQG